MCGIWGAVNLADEHLAELAAQAMRHRGPDDYGIYVNREPVPVSLVNARLSIIDLSEAAHQPLVNEDGRYWIVYNGEVFNFQPLRQVLEEAGHRFRSHSDTEVILHAYEQWGESCVDYLRGMFAFAIWDTREGKLFAARDRLGIKPLYYHLERKNGQTRLLFGSELKTLLSSGLIEPRINLAALHHYLSFYAVPAPYTILEGVQALPAGHHMTFHEGRLTVTRYWDVPVGEPLTGSEDEIIQRLRALLEESIRLRMIADVPVGAFLSGGIDSAAVVALMTRISGERLRTFSVGFDHHGADIDERSAARLMAEHYGTEHTEVIVTGHDVRAGIEQMILALDQPSGDGLNTYLVAQAAGQAVKVALSGLGGDELFAGYPQFSVFRQADSVRRAWQTLPGGLRRAVWSTRRFNPLAARAMPWLEGGVLDRYERVRFLYSEQEKLRLYTPGTVAGLAAPEPSHQYLERFIHPAESDSLVQLMRLELKHYMPHTLLRDTDAMSMAHSLEVRVPLIDHKLVEMAARIPPGMKLRGKQTKWVFIEAVRDLLPPEVLARPKRGFEMPVARWMRNDLRDVLEDTFSRDSLRRRGVFQPEAARAIYQCFLGGEGPYLRPWSLAVFELWCRQFIDAAPRRLRL
ncbi:MAG: asparagine synthase (glutamine-hydrolyzing) [Anaerolineae bacterium]|nr:asparagine synthase (glutamine-hydrolyzing) [Anaerolineae bacterium]